MKSDIQIAHETKLERIENVASQIGIDANDLEHYGKYIAKLPLNLITGQKGKLILVTAITATKAGIGKTTVSIGLALGLNIGSQYDFGIARQLSLPARKGRFRS